MVAFLLFQIPCIHCFVKGEIILHRQHKTTLNNSLCEQSCSIHAMLGNTGIKRSQKLSSSRITHRPLHCLYGGWAAKCAGRNSRVSLVEECLQQRLWGRGMFLGNAQVDTVKKLIPSPSRCSRSNLTPFPEQKSCFFPTWPLVLMGIDNAQLL